MLSYTLITALDLCVPPYIGRRRQECVLSHSSHVHERIIEVERSTLKAKVLPRL